MQISDEMVEAAIAAYAQAKWKGGLVLDYWRAALEAALAAHQPFAVNFTWGHVKDMKTKELTELQAEIRRLSHNLDQALETLNLYANRELWDGEMFIYENDCGAAARRTVRALAAQEGKPE